MSGLVCQIIIHGNLLQASAQASCQLSTETYDGVEVMNDQQRKYLADLMSRQLDEFNRFLAQFLT